jgi:hypothetical protein
MRVSCPRTATWINDHSARSETPTWFAVGGGSALLDQDQQTGAGTGRESQHRVMEELTPKHPTAPGFHPLRCEFPRAQS